MQTPRFSFAFSPLRHLPGDLWRPVCAMVIASAMAFGCATEKPAADSAQVSEEVTAEATVIAVDQEKRLVTLEREDGGKVTIVAGPEVRNLAQIEVGDKVKARYVESLVASLRKPGEAASPPSATVAAGRAEPGEKPQGAVGQQVTVTVRIESVDTESNIVVFTPPDGGLRAIHVKRPQFQEYIKGLKPGDQVEITYTEAVAITVEETAAEE